MQKTIIIILFLVFSCSRLPSSNGDNNEIVIFCSDEDKGLIKFKIDDTFSNYINTPTEENIYKLSWINPVDFKKYKFHKNILIISLVQPKDSTIDLLYNKFAKQYENKSLFSLYNLFSKNQLIIPIGSHNSITFLDFFQSNQNWIVDEVNNNIDLNFKKSLLKKSKNDSIISILNNKFSVDAHIDIDYQVLDNKTNFFRIGRGTPYRWLLFSKIDKNYKNNIWTKYKEIINENIEGLDISNYYKIKDGDFFRGLYEHRESDTGGPLFIYLFDNNDNNEVILVSGFVNNPGKNKYKILKELEIITKNIKEIKNEI